MLNHNTEFVLPYLLDGAPENDRETAQIIHAFCRAVELNKKIPGNFVGWMIANRDLLTPEQILDTATAGIERAKRAASALINPIEPEDQQMIALGYPNQVNPFQGTRITLTALDQLTRILPNFRNEPRIVTLGRSLESVKRICRDAIMGDYSEDLANSRDDKYKMIFGAYLDCKRCEHILDGGTIDGYKLHHHF